LILQIFLMSRQPSLGDNPASLVTRGCWMVYHVDLLRRCVTLCNLFSRSAFSVTQLVRSINGSRLLRRICSHDRLSSGDSRWVCAKRPPRIPAQDNACLPERQSLVKHTLRAIDGPPFPQAAAFQVVGFPKLFQKRHLGSR
jgi:hypothetical protein